MEWLDGVAIMVAIVIVVAVGTINDWQMERQFNQLNKKNNDRTIKVIRSGKSVEISVFDLMVGDVMYLATGDLIPVDGIFISGHSIKCDESSATGESDLLKKAAADEVFAALQEMHKSKTSNPEVEKLDPFIISGSKVQEGTGTFLVTPSVSTRATAGPCPCEPSKRTRRSRRSSTYWPTPLPSLARSRPPAICRALHQILRQVAPQLGYAGREGTAIFEALHCLGHRCGGGRPRGLSTPDQAPVVSSLTPCRVCL